MRVAGAIALLALLALGARASAASAEPLSMTFTEDRANVGLQLADDPMFEPPATAPLAAQIDPGSGEITAGILALPDFSTHITDPINADVTVEFDVGEVTGSFDAATGALSLDWATGGTLSSGGEECDVSTDPAVVTLATSTAASPEGSPRSGSPFTAGLTGRGAVAGAWDDMYAEPVTEDDEWFCEHVEKQIEGPGGIWLEQTGDVAPPSPPQLWGTDPASPSPVGTPRIRGAAEVGSTVSVYAGASCAGAPVALGSAHQLGAPGIFVAVGEGVTATFSATATDAAGNTSACSAPISYTRLRVPPPPRPCVVPNLVGKTLARAKTALAAHGCKLGTVRRPKKGNGRRPFVVKSSSPAAGARPASGKVDLRLGPKPRKAHP